MVVEHNGVRSEPIERPVFEWSPGIFIMDGWPYGQGAILNEGWKANSRVNPARLGSIIAFWATGTGMTDTPSVDGLLTPPVPGQPLSKTPVRVLFAQISGEMQYAGAAPGMVAGVTQINVRLPDTLPPGTTPEAVPISIRMGDGVASVTLATVAVR